MPTSARTSGYDQYAAEYAANVAWREQALTEEAPAGDPLGILPTMLALLGEVAGQAVLHAGRGGGSLARTLAARGARGTGVDLAPRLSELAGHKGSPGEIVYRAADLS